MTGMTIGELARASGVNAKLIRYYESIGLIPEPERNDGNYRVYTSTAIHQLTFIKRSRSLGFSLPEIEKLLGLWQDKQRPSAEVKALALNHVQALEDRIAEMRAMADTLLSLASHCHGDDRPDCPILEDLAKGEKHCR